eukprot:scaffold129929_cov57-Phaeocystis_antarctica.AAC.3
MGGAVGPTGSTSAGEVRATTAKIMMSPTLLVIWCTSDADGRHTALFSGHPVVADYLKRKWIYHPGARPSLKNNEISKSTTQNNSAS